MHNQSVHVLDDEDFERVCGGIIGDIAADRRLTPTGPPELMAPTHDGGIEAKVPTSSGYLGVQCKAYSDFDGEVRSVKKSFETFLDRPEHAGVATYVWCSTAYKTSGSGPAGRRKKGKDTKAQEAIADMVAMAGRVGRAVDVLILFAGDLDRIIRERRPEYFAVMESRAPLRAEDVSSYSSSQAARILSRLGGDETPRLEFPVQRTSQFLDRLLVSTTPPRRVDTSQVKEILDEVQHRAPSRRSHPGFRAQIHTGITDLREAGGALTQHVELAVDDARPLLDALHGTVRSVLADISAELDTHKRSGPGADVELDVALDRLRAFGRAVLALDEELDVLDCEIEAVRTRTLFVTGRWGSGKSFQLAEFTRRAMARGTPVLLLRARDFTRADAAILDQPWRANLPNETAEPAQIAAMLDAIGHRARSPLHIVIDGLNEAALRDPSAAVRRLRATIAAFPNLRLLISTRRDRLPAGGEARPELGHEPPDRVTMSRSVEHALNAPPGTPWHAALTNPLLASVAVMVLSARPHDADRLLSRTSLFEAWVDLLAEETASALGRQVSTIRRVVDAISEADGQGTVTALAATTHMPSSLIDEIVEELADQGLLETSSPTPDSVRLRWEAMTEIPRARRAIQDGEVDEFLGEGGDDRRSGLLQLVAELVPKTDPSRELPDLELTAVSSAQRDLTFAMSLSRRPEREIHRRTEELAASVLRDGGRASRAIVRSVLSVPRRRRLSFTWLGTVLRESTLAERSRFWPQALEELSDQSRSAQDELEQLLSWYAREHWPSITSEEAEPTIGVLAWMGCVNQRTEIPAFATRSLVELLHAHPGLFGPALDQLRDIDDDHPRDTLLAAAAGVIARWPRSGASATIRDVCSRTSDLVPMPQSYRSLSALHAVTGSRRPMHEFLKRSLPPLPRRPLLRTRSLIDHSDRAMFADGRTTPQAEMFESRILSTFSIPRKHLGLVLDEDPESSDDGHGASLVHGRWLARQYAEHAAGAPLFTPRGVIKAGTSQNASAQLLVHPGDAWDHPPDPTVPLALMFHASDVVRSEHWWVISDEKDEPEESDLIVTAPDGVQWIVIDGRFRTLSPPPQNSSDDRPSLTLGFTRWTFPEPDDGRPSPGRVRHSVLTVDDAVLRPRTDSVAHPRTAMDATRGWFSESFAHGATGGELVPMDPVNQIAPLSADLLRLLGAGWGGWGRDCFDGEGELVITDPAVGRNAPHAVLVRKDALDASLRRTAQRISLTIRVTDNLSAMYAPRSTPVVYGGPEPEDSP